MNYWVIAFVIVYTAFIALFTSFVSIPPLSSSILNDWQKANLVLYVLTSFATFLLAFKAHSDSKKNQAKIMRAQLLVFV
jgi:hypothetical protein